MGKSIIILAELDCPHCADKIALKSSKLEGVISADMDFISKKMYVEHKLNENQLVEKISAIVKELEPDVSVRLFKDDKEPGSNSKYTFEILRIVFSAVLFIASFFVAEKISMIILAAAFVVIGYDIIIEAFRNILKGRALDENFLMTIASVGAMIIGEADEGVAVMLFYQIGELFQKRAVESSRRSIKNLMELKPETVNLVTEKGIVTVSPEKVKAGDVIVLKTGERLAVDGILKKGKTTLDMSALTGESVPVEIDENDEVLSGSINLSGVCEIEVTKAFEDSAVSKLLEMVQNSSAQKAKTEKFITRFARIYTPLVVISALLLAVVPPVLTGFSGFEKWIYRALVFLVISCPCALVISVPLSFFAGIGSASKQGILIKGAKYLEGISKCKTVAFDKTGTITKGEFAVREINAVEMDEQSVLMYAASVEKNSNHPIAKSILKAYEGKICDCENVKEIAGYGMTAVVDGHEVICANENYLRKLGFEAEADDRAYTTVWVCVDKKIAGKICLGDSVKESSSGAVEKLKLCGVSDVVMLTGDKKNIAEKIGSQVGITCVKSQLLPEDKVSEIEKLISQTDGVVAYAGDGINDAPVIARADVGIAMGGIGSDAAIEAADVVIMNDDIGKIADAVKISRKTMSIVRQNIVFALGVKLLILVLGALGIAGMWLAVFADVGVSFIAILNALRAMKPLKK